MRTITAAAALVLLAAAPAAAEDLVTEPSPVPTAADGVQVPDFKTKSWIVVDGKTGDVLAGQNYREQRPMASTIKTLTALTLLPRLQYDSTYQAKANETLTEGAHVGVLAGNKYSVSELFHGMMMRSGNDAAVALADAYGYQRTLAAMNAEAQRIGAGDTVAKSPNGLDREGQVSTAADLAQIYRAAIQDERLRAILTTREAQFPGRPPIQPTDARGSYTIYNRDSLLTSDYPGFLGAKTGFTSQAGRTYVAGAEQNGRTMVVALLGIGGGTTETAREVLDWSFANAGALQPVETLPELPGPAEVTPEAAGSNAAPGDVAPTPPDPQTAATVTAIAQQAQSAVQQAAADIPEIPGPEEVAAAAVAAAESAAGNADEARSVVATSVAQEAISTAALAADSVPQPLDPQQVAADAVAAASAAAAAVGLSTTDTTTTSVVSGAGGAALGSAAPADATVAAAPAAEEEAPQQRGFFASLLVGLFKAFMWTLLFLGIAVVLLRIRAVRRQKARREAYLEAMRQRVDENLPADSTYRRDPVHTK